MELENPPRTSHRAEKPFAGFPDTQEAFLEWIDLGALNDILAKLQIRSGVEHPKPLSRADIRFGRTYGEGKGENMPGTMEVVLTHDFFTKEKGAWTALEALATLIHEALHGISSSSVSFPDPKHSGTTIEETRSGLQDATFWRNADGAMVMSEKRGARANEALTEFLALEVLKEYARRTGQSNMMPDKKSVDAPGAYIGQVAYAKERAELSVIADALGTLLKVPGVSVHGALARQYFSGEENNKDFFEAIGSALDELEKLSPTQREFIEMRAGHSVDYWHAVEHVAKSLRLAE